MTKMLPFTRPTLDEETIQSVVEVLRSGWLAIHGKAICVRPTSTAIMITHDAKSACSHKRAR